MKHITVLLNETIALLQIKEDGIYADLTLGGGGHSLEILKRLKSGKLISFDLDQSAIKNFETRLIEEKIDHSLSTVVNSNFKDLSDHLDSKADGIIADLGWSTDQLENLEGLSHSNELADLDMRFDSNLGVKASDLLNAFNRNELSKMFKEYSDIYGKQNDDLVEEILKFRSSKLFQSVGDLKQVIDKVFFREKNKNSFYSKVFQALRIAVNQELSNLQEMLERGYENLNSSGKFLIITFHSGESKVVKSFFDEKVQNGEAKYLTKKLGEVFVTPSVDELRENINSRSAKLFGIEKLN